MEAFTLRESARRTPTATMYRPPPLPRVSALSAKFGEGQTSGPRGRKCASAGWPVRPRRLGARPPSARNSRSRPGRCALQPPPPEPLRGPRPLSLASLAPSRAGPQLWRARKCHWCHCHFRFNSSVDSSLRYIQRIIVKRCNHVFHYSTEQGK